MAGQSRWTNKWLIGCVLAFALFGVRTPAEDWAGDVIWGGGNVQFEGRFWPGANFAPSQAPTAQTQDGFVVMGGGETIEDTPAGEAIQLIQDSQWIKAIQAIESLSTAEDRLIVDNHSMLRPLSTMKSALIASMPEAGRRAFTKLNDPAANTRLREALEQAELDPRASALKTIVDDYALCDASAAAAKHLGDIRFEQGRFDEAAAYYRFAADHPANITDDASLIARRLTALARAERWSAFDELAEYARFRHADTTIQIAGQDTVIPTFIAGLAAMRQQIAPPQPTTNTQPTRLSLPESIELEYDRPLLDEVQRRLLKFVATNNNFGGIIDQTIAPAITSDNDRLFTLGLGSVARLDPETGTELWRVGEIEPTVKNIQSRIYNLAGPLPQSLLIHEDVLLVARPNNDSRLTAYLAALDPDTGETKWLLQDRLRSDNESVVGQPLVFDGRVYFVTHNRSLDLTLYCVNLSDGLEVGKAVLGKVSKGPNLRSPAELSPRLAMGRSHLIVQTNNGALIAIDLSDLSIAWALTQKIRPSMIGQMRRRGVYVNNAIAKHTGTAIATGGLVFAKDTRTNRVVALREHDAALLWSVETDADATIVHHDDKHLYVLGEELVALDQQTGERVWWTPHAGDKSGKPVFTEDACLIAGNLRLCRIDLATGKLTQYREDLIGTADLHLIGQQLIATTDQRIKAVRLPQ